MLTLAVTVNGDDRDALLGGLCQNFFIALFLTGGQNDVVGVLRDDILQVGHLLGGVVTGVRVDVVPAGALDGGFHVVGLGHTPVVQVGVLAESHRQGTLIAGVLLVVRCLFGTTGDQAQCHDQSKDKRENLLHVISSCFVLAEFSALTLL